MSAGRRSCRIDIYSPGNSEATGEPNPSPVLFRTVWASLIPMRGRERELGEMRQGLAVYRARVDYRDGAGITEAMVAEYEGRRFNIGPPMIDFETRRTVDFDMTAQEQGA